MQKDESNVYWTWYRMRMSYSSSTTSSLPRPCWQAQHILVRPSPQSWVPGPTQFCLQLPLNIMRLIRRYCTYHHWFPCTRVYHPRQHWGWKGFCIIVVFNVKYYEGGKTWNYTLWRRKGNKNKQEAFSLPLHTAWSRFPDTPVAYTWKIIIE